MIVLLPQERFVIQVTDLLTVSMMLGITAQVKEAGIAWDKGEKKSKPVFILPCASANVPLSWILIRSCEYVTRSLV